jgi:hypothetical protein
VINNDIDDRYNIKKILKLAKVQSEENKRMKE